MRNRILVDSGFLIALYDTDSILHEEVTVFAQAQSDSFLFPAVILPEVCYVLRRNTGNKFVTAFLTSFAGSTAVLEQITMVDGVRIAQLRLQYADANLDFVDCAIIATAERLNITMIATLDTRDFTLVRPTHCDFFEIFP